MQTHLGVNFPSSVMSCFLLVWWEGKFIPFFKGKFRQIRREGRILPASVDSQLPSTQKNLYANAVYFGQHILIPFSFHIFDFEKNDFTYCVALQISEISEYFTLWMNPFSRCTRMCFFYVLLIGRCRKDRDLLQCLLFLHCLWLKIVLMPKR